MKIIIAGAGEVGFHLAKLLSFEAQDITLIDLNQEKLEYADSHLDIITICDDATAPRVLKEAQIEDADLLIAVTASDTSNFMIAVLGKRFGAKKTIARMGSYAFQNSEQKEDLRVLGIDEVISPEKLAADEIFSLIGQSCFNESFDFDHGLLHLVGAVIKENSPVAGLTMAEASIRFHNIPFNTISVQRDRNQETIVPRGETVFMPGDQVYFVTNEAGYRDLYKLVDQENKKIEKIMILGGSRIGVNSAKLLCDDKYRVKLFEKDKDKSFKIADKFPGMMVINGDGRNVELLQEENIDDVDAFVALTGDSETNIMSCLVAKGRGVKKTIALVENMDYLHLSQSIGIDSLINKKFLAASQIVRYIRSGEVLALTNINNSNAEVLEYEVKEHCKIRGKELRDLRLPRQSIVGGIVRGEDGILPKGNFKIEEGDHILIFCLPEAISDVEKLFK
ncbi:MAG: Trk system potassium transporter TrkA [Flavobacteriales bacterium]|jgi:trk system potassium uptake protein TrkA|nr:Trk system potassium transporter TrkA [Flavobacteriales bacterium]